MKHSEWVGWVETQRKSKVPNKALRGKLEASEFRIQFIYSQLYSALYFPWCTMRMSQSSRKVWAVRGERAEWGHLGHAEFLSRSSLSSHTCSHITLSDRRSIEQRLPLHIPHRISLVVAGAISGCSLQYFNHSTVLHSKREWRSLRGKTVFRMHCDRVKSEAKSGYRLTSDIAKTKRYIRLSIISVSCISMSQA